MAITLTDNEFFTGLTNLALFMRIYATNTSTKVAEFVDSFMTDRLDKGNQKLFPWADLRPVENYSETSTLLQVNKATHGEEALRITEKKVIKSSYSAQILDSAFTSEYGMNDFIGYILGQMESAKEAHLYDVIINDLYGLDFDTPGVVSAKQKHEIALIDTTGLTSVSDRLGAKTYNGEQIAKAMQDDIRNIQVYNRLYNALGIDEAVKWEELRVVINSDYELNEVVNVMATLLRSNVIDDKFDKPDKLVIPSIKVPAGQEAVIGWIMHKAFYQVFYKFSMMTSFFDASNLCVNNFLHFWYGKGALKALPCVKLVATVEAGE